MEVEADAIAWALWRSERRRLADIVKEDAPGKGGRRPGRQLFKHQQRVQPDVSLGMELRWLLDTFHQNNFG